MSCSCQLQAYIYSKPDCLLVAHSCVRDIVLIVFTTAPHTRWRTATHLYLWTAQYGTDSEESDSSLVARRPLLTLKKVTRPSSPVARRPPN